MQGKFQEILAQIGMVANAEAPNQSTFLEETTEGYVKTHLELLPDGNVKVVLESVFPLFEGSTTEIASRITTAQKSLLTE
jgi:hypothetical protein